MRVLCNMVEAVKLGGVVLDLSFVFRPETYAPGRSEVLRQPTRAARRVGLTTTSPPEAGSPTDLPFKAASRFQGAPTRIQRRFETKRGR